MDINILPIILIAIAITLLIIWLKSYKIKHDTILAFTGGLGSGKSFLSVNYAIRLYKKNVLSVKIKNFFSKDKKPLPILLSNIPVLIKKDIFSYQLTEKHLLLQEKVPEKSVVFIDEIDSFASQYDFKEKNIVDIFDEFIRLFRHYTQGGYLVVNSQCSENIVLVVRRRLNQVVNLMNFQKFLCFYRVRVRNISISEEIKTIEQEDTEDNMTYKIGLIPFSRHYDTYCYSKRYDTVPKVQFNTHTQLKTNTLMKNSKADYVAKTDNEPLKYIPKYVPRLKKLKKQYKKARSWNDKKR